MCVVFQEALLDPIHNTSKENKIVKIGYTASLLSVAGESSIWLEMLWAEAYHVIRKVRWVFIEKGTEK